MKRNINYGFQNIIIIFSNSKFFVVMILCGAEKLPGQFPAYFDILFMKLLI